MIFLYPPAVVNATFSRRFLFLGIDRLRRNEPGRGLFELYAAYGRE
jgi:hypothetical protein